MGCSMMEIVVKLNQLKEGYLFDQADAFLLANEDFSLRYNHSFSLDEIKQLKTSTTKKIYVLMNKIFLEEELEAMENFLRALQEMQIDGIYFADFAVFMVAKKLHFEDHLFFYHETFLRNCYDIKTYQELKIQNIICSKDMCFDDIKQLDCKNKNHYGIVVFGYMPLYYSKRKILFNFNQNHPLNIPYENHFELFLKEEKRDDLYPILEQKNETTIFQNTILSYADEVSMLKQYLHYFIVDSLFFSTNFIQEVIQIIKDDKGEKQKRIEALNHRFHYTTGFLFKKAGLFS